MAFICLAFVAGSFAADPNNSNMQNMPTTAKKTIKLPSNPTTGYHWVAQYNKVDVKLLTHSFKLFYPKLEGSGGIETFQFEGIKGEKIVMYYIKDGDKKPLKTHTYIIE